MVRGPSNEQGETQGMPQACRGCGYDLQRSRIASGTLVCSECGMKQEATPRPAGPLSGDDYAQLELARKRGKKVLKAAKVASFDAWTMAIIGGSALAFGVVDHVSGVVGGAIMIVAMVEFKGAAKFRKMDLGAPMLCGLNQLFLLATIAVYCVWNLMQNQPSVMQSIGDPMGDAVLGDVASMESSIMKAFYGLVLIGSVLMQGLTAVYYFTRARHMRRYLHETPAWIVELQKRTG